LAKPSDFFQCKLCGECCKGYGGAFVNEREIKRISQYLHMDSDSFLREYCRWSGGRPLIRSSDSGYCIFWDKVCTIHRVKPRMCSTWPFIDSMLVDPANWAIVQSVCPGILGGINDEELAECVSQVAAEYERQWSASGVPLTDKRGLPKSPKGLSS